MKTIQEVCPHFDGYSASYKMLVSGFEYETLLWEDDNDYQGDSRVLLFDSEKEHFGLLTFGWGSCSGCDALQACKTYNELQELYDDLHSQIRWFENEHLLYTFFFEHDWEGDYGFSISFNEKAIFLANSIIRSMNGDFIEEETIITLRKWAEEAQEN